MKPIKKEVEVYETNDGVLFSSSQDAKNYEKLLTELSKQTLFQVLTNPDLTEGRGYNKSLFVVAPTKLALIHYLFICFGDPMSLVQGCAPMPTWSISSVKPLRNILGQELREMTFDELLDKHEVNLKELIVLDERGKPNSDAERNIVQDFLKLKRSQLKIVKS